MQWAVFLCQHFSAGQFAFAGRWSVSFLVTWATTCIPLHRQKWKVSEWINRDKNFTDLDNTDHIPVTLCVMIDRKSLNRCVVLSIKTRSAISVGWKNFAGSMLLNWHFHFLCSFPISEEFHWHHCLEVIIEWRIIKRRHRILELYLSDRLYSVSIREPWSCCTKVDYHTLHRSVECSVLCSAHIENALLALQAKGEKR